MPPFLRVEGDKAGPSALGILVPPGRRTLVILRPRALEWDLLLQRAGSSGGFWEVDQGQAAGLVNEIRKALEAWAGGGPGQILAVPAAAGPGFHIVADIGPYRLVACQRALGKPYQLLNIMSLEEAKSQAELLKKPLCPGRDANQEVYFNHRNFAR